MKWLHQVRTLAAATGSKSKGGQAKTAIKTSTGLKADIPALPFYKPLPKTGPLPDASLIRVSISSSVVPYCLA